MLKISNKPGPGIPGRSAVMVCVGAWVAKIICTCDPLGGGPGINGLGLNVHVAPAGKLLQAMVNARFDPAAWNMVNAIVTL
jgi:hypothetical protein